MARIHSIHMHHTGIIRTEPLLSGDRTHGSCPEQKCKDKSRLCHFGAMVGRSSIIIPYIQLSEERGGCCQRAQNIRRAHLQTLGPGMLQGYIPILRPLLWFQERNRYEIQPGLFPSHMGMPRNRYRLRFQIHRHDQAEGPEIWRTDIGNPLYILI